MSKLKLSAYISIDDVDVENDSIPQNFLSGHFVLYDEAQDKEFIINDTVKYFIDKFSSPATEEEVIQQVKKDVKSSDEKVEKTCNEFIRFLCRKKILVPEDKLEVPVKWETLYQPGELIGDYCIEEVVANKRYLDIYLASHPHYGHTIIKLLNKQKAATGDQFDKEFFNLEREFSLLHSLNHLSVTSHAYSFVPDQNGSAYLTIEYIPGKNLLRFLKDKPQLTQAAASLLIENIVTGFSFLHDCNLIHGDIHPSNVMVAEDLSIKIIDLGLSRTVHTENNEVIKHGGVHFYMPPERINISSAKKFSTPPDLYSDVYQVGLLMYMVLYNTTPFKGFIWEELAHNIKEQDPVLPATSVHGFEVSPQLIRTISRCLAKHPEERFTDAAAILADLKKSVFTAQEEFVN